MYCRKTFEELLDPNSPVKPFSFLYDGKPCDLSRIPCTVEEGRDGNRRMIYEVIPGKVLLTLEMILWPDFPVIEYTPYFENISQSDSGIISGVSVLDYETEDAVVFGEQVLGDKPYFGNSRLRIRYRLGSKASGADYLPQVRDLFSRPGSSFMEISNVSAWCSTDFLPFIGIDSDPMTGIDLGIGWNGAWTFSAEKECQDTVWGSGKKSRIRCGMKRAAFRLRPGERLMQPGVLLHFREGKSIREGQNEFRRFMIAHHAPRNSRGELIKPPLCLAFWGGLETDRQRERIRLAREKKLPYEEVWVDAGWMGSPGPCPHFLEKSEHTSDWYLRVGSWDFNTYAHPKGLRPVSEAAHEAGMRLLVWFEALRVFSASGSAVLTEHPEWLLANKTVERRKDQHVSYLFNVGIPEAEKYLFEVISGIIEREGIDDYREDFNMDAWPYLISNDEPDRIGVTEMKFVEGFYRFWGDLRKRFPDMFIDNCAGGGRRQDYKTASLGFPLCQSDFGCFSVYEEESVQMENIYLDDWIPLHGTLNWGPEDPYHMASGLGGGFGSKVWQFNGRDPKPDHDYDLHRRLLEWGKQLRDLHMTGDVYPLVESPENDCAKWNGQQIHISGENRGMVQIYRRKHSPDPDFVLNLSGLDPESRYRVEFFTGEVQTLSGRELSKLTVHLAEPRSFQFLRYEPLKDGK